MRISQRIWRPMYFQKKYYHILESFLQDYPECVDEISLFVDFLHTGKYPLDRFQKDMEVVQKRKEQFIKAGYSHVGFNLLSTIGHLPEATEYWGETDYQMAVDQEGNISDGTYCMNSSGFLEYVIQKYSLLALQHPDFIWVDDDIRFHSHDIKYACFCPKCILDFNKKYDTMFDRKTLVSLLKHDTSGEWRKRWIEENTIHAERLLTTIENTVHSIDPNIELGLMTTTFGWTTYSFAGYRRLFTALCAVKGRPGGGFWNEMIPSDYLVKGIEIGRQISEYPGNLKDIQYEVESLPYQMLEKSPHMIINECTAALMNGCNGIAMDTIRQDAGNLKDYEVLFQQTSKARKLWETIECEDYLPYGCASVLSPTYMGEPNTEDSWFDLEENVMTAYHTNKCYPLLDIGIPVTAFNNAENPVHILEGDLARGYSKEQIKEWVSTGVFMDYKALSYLEEIGLDVYCGVKTGKEFSTGIREVFTADTFNIDADGSERDLRMQAICHEKCCELKVCDPNVRILSRLKDFAGEDQGAAFTIFENNLGGRIAVSSYMPWTHIASSEKRTQLQKVFSWLSNGSLPEIPEYCKIAPFIKKAIGRNRYIIMLNNILMEPSGKFSLLLHSENDEAKIYRRDSSYQIIKGTKEGEKTKFEIDGINTFDFLIFIV